ncbi:MAG: isoleucine--tRNA ligase [Chloroflexota bacterium]|nr:MAG: isoleucine--tRNA ligase [Chloroflexota bacterium]
MFRSVGSKVNFAELEEATLRFWKDHEIFAKSQETREDALRYVFYEGPPTANGSPGIHHVLARVFKDLICRYWTMQGRKVLRKAGWDTHGLPVELEVEKELGITSKSQIEEYGIAKFNARCRESVFRYVEEWEWLTDRIGYWVDMQHPYITYTNGYIESCWWIIRQFWDKGLLYQGHKVTPHCPRCGTSLSDHEVALGYKEDAVDPSVYVKMRITKDQAQQRFGLPELPTSFLVWTTTPWTLPGNTAVAVAPDADYAIVRVPGPTGSDELLILAEALLGAALQDEYNVVKTVRGANLVGMTYEPLYSFVPLAGKSAFRAVGADFVSMDDGTGIVHIAPAFGEIDLQIGKREDLPVIQTVDLRGEMTPNTGAFAGKFVKQADPLITEDLRERGLLYQAGTITHTYPFCWRCDTPLLYYAKTSWYIQTTALKEALLEGNELINWYPEHIKHGRFGDWLEHNVDWALSRERFWGTPLPIWRCQSCDAKLCVGSVAELRERAIAGDKDKVTPELDLHRPYIDQITLTCPTCGGHAKREPEVIDVWFDSGAMPVAQWHYPFENQARFVEQFPADFISEAVDQTRGWFYSLHAESTLLFAKPCYRNVICLGLVLDAKGEKMSKSRGNVVKPRTVLDAHGADALRWYLYTASPPGNARRFSTDLVGEVVRKFMLTLWNTYSFFVTYANIDGWSPQTPEGQDWRAVLATSESLLDRWILSELNQLIVRVNDMLSNYDPTGAGREIQAFVDDLSNWYVRRSRRRFWKSESDQDKLAAYATLYECLSTVTRLLAPFTPFLADELYQNLVRNVDPHAPESVHLDRFPVASKELIDTRLNDEMQLLMKVVSLGRAARSKAALKVRQPLTEVAIKTRTREEEDALRRLSPILLDELNVKKVQFVEDESELVSYTVKPNLPVLGPKYGKEMGLVTESLKSVEPSKVAAAVRSGSELPVDGYVLLPNEILVQTTDRLGWSVSDEAGYFVALSTHVTPELRDEGLARELVRRLQEMRRSAGFDIADHIVTTYQGAPALENVMQRFARYIQQETLSDLLTQGPPVSGAYTETHKIDGDEIVLAVQRTDYP